LFSPLPRADSQDLDEFADGLKDAESKWSEIHSKLLERSANGSGKRKKRKSKYRQESTGYVHVSLDDDAHPEKRDLANLERMLYSNLAACVGKGEATDDPNSQTEDDEALLFWWRFFGVRTTDVQLKRFCRAMSLYLRHEFNQFIGSEEVLEQMVRQTVDTGSDKEAEGKSHDNIVSDNEFREFVSRYGPLRSCFNKMRGVCVVKGNRIEPADWFYPYDRLETESLLKFGKQGRAPREWVARLGWRHKNMAFVFSYIDKKDPKHTPVTHGYKQETEDHVYEIELQHIKMSGVTMRHLILNICSNPDEKTPIFGEHVRLEKRKAEGEDDAWTAFLQGLQKKQHERRTKEAIAEGFEEVFELNTFFERGGKDEKRRGGGKRPSASASAPSEDTKAAAAADGLRESMLETESGRKLLKWMQATVTDIRKNIRHLSSADVGTRKEALRSLQRLAVAAASSNMAALNEDNRKELESVNPFARSRPARMDARTGGDLKHYQWAFNDYRRNGQTVIHELVDAATTLIMLLSKKGGLVQSRERDLCEAFRSVTELIRSLSIIGMPMHVRNDEGETPVEAVVTWFANHRGKAQNQNLSLIAVQLFHELFIAVYERTTVDLRAAELGDRAISDRTHKAILVKVFRGIIPQGDIEIIEYLVKHDKALRHMLRHETKRDRNIFLSLTTTATDSQSTALNRHSAKGGGGGSGGDSTVSFLHYLIHQTANNHMDTHFDAYGNAPRIAKLVFAELPPRTQGLYCSLPGGESADTPILAAARASHRPMMHFLLHIGTRLRKEHNLLAERLQSPGAEGGGGGGGSGRPLPRHPTTSNLFGPAFSPPTPGSGLHHRGDSAAHAHAQAHPSRQGSLSRIIRSMSMTFESLEDGLLGTPICEMADREGNCLLHFLVEGPTCTLREVTMVLSALDSAGESTNAMVDRMNVAGETPLTKLLSRYRELTKLAITTGKNSVQATETANIALFLLARGARTQGLRQDEMEVLAEIAGAAMARCVNYRWTILRNAVQYGDDRLVDLILTSKAVRTFPFLKHPRFEMRKARLKKRRKEQASKIIAQIDRSRYTSRVHTVGTLAPGSFQPHGNASAQAQASGANPRMAWGPTRKLIRHGSAVNDLLLGPKQTAPHATAPPPYTQGGAFSLAGAADPFESISDHTLLHVATSSPHSSSKIVERLFRHDQYIAERKFRGRLKELMLTPSDLVAQLKQQTSRMAKASQHNPLGGGGGGAHDHHDHHHRGQPPPARDRFARPYSMMKGHPNRLQNGQTDSQNLLRLGLNLADDCEKNPLHYISSKQNTQTRAIAKLLVENSIDIVHMDADGMTPLHVAARANQLEIVDLMVNTHMHLDIKTGRVQEDYSLWSSAVRQMGGNFARANDKHDRTALFFAVEQGNWQICSLLLARKAQVDEFDSQGKTALTVAFQARYGRLTDEALYKEATDRLGKWAQLIEDSGGVTTAQKKQMLKRVRHFLWKKQRNEREFSVTDPLDRARQVLQAVEQAILQVVPCDAGDEEEEDEKHRTFVTPASGNLCHSPQTQHQRMVVSPVSADNRSAVRNTSPSPPPRLQEGSSPGNNLNVTDPGAQPEPGNRPSLHQSAPSPDEAKGEKPRPPPLTVNPAKADIAKLTHRGLSSSQRGADLREDEELVAELLATIQEAKIAFDSEWKRIRPIKNNLKVTIDVLLAAGADIDLAFRLVTMDVSDCIDIRMEFVRIEQKFQEIEQEAEEAFKLVKDANTVFNDTAMSRTRTGLPVLQEKQAYKDDANEPSLQTIHLRRPRVGTAAAASDGVRSTKSKMGTRFFERLQKSQEDAEDVEAKQTAIQERREAVFKIRYNQIVIDQKYKKTVHNARFGELWWYLLFLGLITYVGIHTASRNNKASFFMRKAAIANLIDDEFPYNVSQLKRNFMDIDSTEEFFLWAKGPFLDVVYPEEAPQFYSDGHLTYRNTTFLVQNRVVGVPRWRQQRWDTVNCALLRNEDLAGPQDLCTTQIDPWPWLPVLDHTGDKSRFGPAGENDEGPYEYQDPPGAFSYSWASGTNRWYPGGGYSWDFPQIQPLDESRTATRRLISEIEESGWIDAFTRALFVEFTVYNANEDLWMIVRMNLEFPNTGGVIPSKDINVLTEISFPFKKASISIWVLKGIVLLFIIWNFVQWIVDWFFVKNKASRIGSGDLNIESLFNFVNLAINVLYILVILSQIALLVKTLNTDFSETTKFVDMSEVSFLGEGYTNFFSILLFLLWIKLTDHLSVNKNISRLVVMILVLLRELVYLLWFLAIMWIAFGCGIFVAYGYRNDGNALWVTSLLASVSNSFNGQELIDDRDKAPFLGTIYGLVALIIVILVLMNLVIAILTAAYENAREEVGDAYWARHQYGLVQEYLTIMGSKIDASIVDMDENAPFMKSLRDEKKMAKDDSDLDDDEDEVDGEWNTSGDTEMSQGCKGAAIYVKRAKLLCNECLNDCLQKSWLILLAVCSCTICSSGESRKSYTRVQDIEEDEVKVVDEETGHARHQNITATLAEELGSGTIALEHIDKFKTGAYTPKQTGAYSPEQRFDLGKKIL